MVHLSIVLLGDIAVRRAEEEITAFRSAKNQALLAYLAVEAGRGHDRDVLAGMFWPEHPEAAARLNLRQSLFRLRKLLNGDDTEFISVDRHTVRFNGERDHWLDVTAFRHLLELCAGHIHARRASCAPCAARLAEAVALYRGDFLAGMFLGDSVAVEEWILFKREWLRHQVLDALADLAAFHEQEADYDQAYRYAWRQVELDPLREEAYRQIMRALALAGQRSEALAQYEICRRVLADELGVEPAAETTVLIEAIRAGTLAPLPSPQPRDRATQGRRDRPAHNLPAMQTRLIGREAELASLRQWLLDPDERQISLVGGGGVGKSRLGHAAALSVVQHFRDGVWFVPLAGVMPHDSPARPKALADALVTAIAGAVGLTFQGTETPRTQLLNYLSGQELLLLLDNFDHLLPAAAFLAGVLQTAPGVTLLVTSRERLNVQAERVVRVTGLPVPAADEREAGRCSSVKLFVERARRTSLDFTLNETILPHVVQICRLVEGLPLGLELAASWVEQFTPAEIAVAIGQTVDFLTTSMRDLPERHRSLRATFEYSWHLLSPQEQTVLAQCAIFHETWSRQATLAVTAASLPHLISLVNKSLLQVVAPGRYTLHTLVRQLAREKLEAMPAVQQAARARHCRYYVDLLAGHEGQLLGEAQSKALATLDGERQNVRAAWDWAVQHGELAELARAARSLQMLYEYRNYFREGEALFARAAGAVAALPVSPARDHLWGQLLAHQGVFVFSLGGYEPAAHLFKQSLDLLQDGEDGSEIAWVLGYLGLVRERQGRYEEAKAIQEQSLAHYSARDDRQGIANALRLMAGTAEGLKQYPEAKELLAESLALYQESGNRRGAALALNLLGIVTEMQEAYKEARRHYRESLAIFTELDDKWGMQLPLGNLGDVAFTLGDYEEARAYYCAALDVLQTSWAVSYMLIQLYRIAAVLTKEGRLEEAAELLYHPLHHPHLDQAFRQRAEALYAELVAELPPAVLAAAQSRGGQKSLAQTVKTVC